MVHPLPLRLCIWTLAGWLNRRQQDVIAYLEEENRILREQLGGRRLQLTDTQRRRLARRAQRVGRRGLREISTLVTPETLLRWYRQLVARKYDGSRKRRPGRPRLRQAIERLIPDMAHENPGWGYTRIQGALYNLGHQIGRSTVRRMLIENGIDPAGRRPTSWRTFLEAHWG